MMPISVPLLPPLAFFATSRLDNEQVGI